MSTGYQGIRTENLVNRTKAGIYVSTGQGETRVSLGLPKRPIHASTINAQPAISVSHAGFIEAVVFLFARLGKVTEAAPIWEPTDRSLLLTITSFRRPLAGVLSVIEIWTKPLSRRTLLRGRHLPADDACRGVCRWGAKTYRQLSVPLFVALRSVHTTSSSGLMMREINPHRDYPNRSCRN